MQQFRKIRSFVRREGRNGKLDATNWDPLWQQYGADIVKDNFHDLFTDNLPIVLEIGFGDGRNTLAQAIDKPEYNYLGIEVYKTGVAKLMSDLNDKAVGNVRVSTEDANLVLEDFIPDHSLDKVLIFFSDPWQKKRHHKRRLIQENFLRLAHQKLKQGGEIHIATDWQNYAEHIDEILPKIEDVLVDTSCGQRSNFRVITKFEQRAIDEGRAVSEFCLRSK